MLRIRLLGEFSLVYGDQPVTGVNTPRLQSLLAYLVLHREAAQPRRHLAFLFWPDSSEAQARTNLRKLLHQLQRALPAAATFLRADGQTLQWRDEAPFSLDVADFERALAQAHSLRHLQAAADLYGGDLLPDCYDDWILPERERLRQLFGQTLERLVALLESERDYRAAIPYAQRLLRLDPLREESYRDLIRLHALGGDRTGVVRTYRACVTVLRRELDVEPSMETRAAYERGLRMAATAQAGPESVARPDLVLNNLPLLLSRFIGRQREIGQVRQLVLAHRLVTLTGAGGIGKTRLALAVARELLGAFSDGVWHVDLAALSDPALVVPAVAAVLGVREEGGRPLRARLSESLRPKHLLLVLDNCEHLTAAVRSLAEALLSAAPEVRILATSRAVLGAAGEVTWRVPSLSTPDMSQWPATARPRGAEDYQDRASMLGQYESVQVFADRAAAVLPTFAVTEDNAWAVGRICQQLDGIPLALELAAARVRLLTVQQIADLLQDALRLLTQGQPTALPRHQTLQATLEWSYALLKPPEQVLFRRLAVFAGSFTLEAAEAVCDIPPAAILDELSYLVDKSLVEPLPMANVMRYRLLEVVRQFACARLRDAGEEQLIRRRHRDYYLRWAERGEPELRGARQLEWCARFEHEYDNLSAAMEWCRHEADAENGLRLAAALWWFWRMRGRLSEGRARIAQMLALPSGPVHAGTRARALNAAGFLALFQGDFPAARQYAQEALAIAQELGDQQAMALALYTLGDDVVAESVERGMAIRKQSLALSEAIGDRWMMAFTLNALGELARLQDDYVAARSFYERALQIRRELQDRRGIAVCLTNLGFVALRQGQIEQARDLLRQVLATRWELRDAVGVAETLVGMVVVIAESGDREAVRRAARWLGSLSAQLDDIWTPLTGADRREFETVTARVRACLGEDDLQRALAEGRQIPFERAVADALEGHPRMPAG